MDGKLIVALAAVALAAFAAGLFVAWLVFRPKSAKTLPPKKGAPAAKPLAESVPWECGFCGQTNRASTRFCRKCGKPNVPVSPARRLDEQAVADAQRKVQNAAQSAANHGPDGWACHKCGRINRKGARHCAGCGTAQTKECKFCGKRIAVGAKFCNNCGKPA